VVVGQPVHMVISCLATKLDVLRDDEHANLVDEEVKQRGGFSPRKIMPLQAEATQLGTSPAMLVRSLLEYSAAIHFGSRVWTASLLSHLIAGVESKPQRIKPIGLLTAAAFDETMMPFRAQLFASTRRFPEMLPGAVLNMLGDATKRFSIVEIPLTCPLQLTDSACGESLVALYKEQIYVPLLDACRKAFTRCVDLTINDSAKSNVRAENGLVNEKEKRSRLRFGCQIHHVSIVQGKTYGMICPTVSGMIAFSLAQMPAGSVCKLRDVIALVICESTICADGLPPAADDQCMVRRNALLDLCLGASTTDLKRRSELERLIASDISEDTIYVYPGHEAAFDKMEYAEKLANAVLPKAVPLMQRRRWMSSTVPISECALLACAFNLLSRALPYWVCVLKGKDPGPVPLEKPGSAWDILDDAAVAGQGQQDQIAELVEDSTISPPPQDWSAWNNKQRSDTVLFAKSDPGPILIIARVTLQSQVKLLTSLGNISSEMANAAVLQCSYGGQMREPDRRLLLCSSCGQIIYSQCDVHV
jgi:hypothetical protein